MATDLPDGLDALRAELGPGEIITLIARTARWVSRETFQRLPIWYPEHTRRGLFYKSNWSEPLFNTNRQTGVRVHKIEGNLYANKALTYALGLSNKDRPNWSCCHIWGIDDESYASTNVIVQDARFYSCIGNMVLLPSPLKAFTDVMPEVKAMLRACAANTYGWQCDHPDLVPSDVEQATASEFYPEAWPRTEDDPAPPGTIPLTNAIAKRADERLARIKDDLKSAGPYYPREQVREALSYWKIDVD